MGRATRTALRALVGMVLFGAGLVLSVVTFTAITLALGDPFYEKLSEKVEGTYGEVPPGHELPLWKSIPRSVRDSLVTLGYLLLFTIPLFFLGFVPVIGQTVVPVLVAAGLGLFPHGRADRAGPRTQGNHAKATFRPASGQQGPGTRLWGPPLPALSHSAGRGGRDARRRGGCGHHGPDAAGAHLRFPREAVRERDGSRVRTVRLSSPREAVRERGDSRVRTTGLCPRWEGWVTRCSHWSAAVTGPPG